MSIIDVDDTLLDLDKEEYARLDMDLEKASTVLVAMLHELTERVIGYAMTVEDTDMYLDITHSIFRVRSVVALKLLYNCPDVAYRIFN